MTRSEAAIRYGISPTYLTNDVMKIINTTVIKEIFPVFKGKKLTHLHMIEVTHNNDKRSIRSCVYS